ncbi:hypothetical protein ACLOJK_034089 [Asimina triloba]
MMDLVWTHVATVNGFLLRLLDLAKKWWRWAAVRMVLLDVVIAVNEEDGSAMVGMGSLDEMGSTKKKDLADLAA